MDQLREIYADGDETELMKMAIRMPDALKNRTKKLMKMIGLNPNRYRRSCSKHLDFRRDEGMSLEKEFTTYWQYSSA
jgi:arginyl-tRNA synthetase